MTSLLDFLPIVVFFITYKLYDIYYASGAFIIAFSLLLIYTQLRFHKVKRTALISFIITVIFNSLTLYYHNEVFIKCKVTVIYTLLAAALLISQIILDKPLIQQMLDKKIHLPIKVWNNLNIAWSLFFLACGIANIYIAFYFPQCVWVNFKVFFLTCLTAAFTIISGIYIYNHIIIYKHNDNVNHFATFNTNKGGGDNNQQVN